MSSFGYGFVQGVEAAAAEKNVKAEVNYSWLYGSTFSASPELQTMAAGWYQNGTQAIFACGGSMFASVSAAAEAADAKVIGVDTDQSFESDTVITSATKGLASSVQWALAKFYAGEFAEIGGVGTALKNCIAASKNPACATKEIAAFFTGIFSLSIPCRSPLLKVESE